MLSFVKAVTFSQAKAGMLSFAVTFSLTKAGTLSFVRAVIFSLAKAETLSFVMQKPRGALNALSAARGEAGDSVGAVFSTVRVSCFTVSVALGVLATVRRGGSSWLDSNLA